MIHVTLTFTYKGVPIEITLDTTVPEALGVEHLGRMIDRVKLAIDTLFEGKKNVSQYEKV
jgi:hypothetical protein